MPPEDTHHDDPAERPFEAFVLTEVPSHAEADLIVGLLRAHGIDAFTSADDIGGTYPGFGTVRVVVEAADAEQARAVLEAAPLESFD